MAVCEKRSLEEIVHNAKNVLLDIEGTTTSISFVKDTLFPYIRKSLESYVTANWEEDEFKEVLSLLREQATADVDTKVEGAVAIPSEGSVDEQQAAVVSNVLWQMDQDRKTTALKLLQGLVWRLGYKDGELKGHVYPDVAPALKQWTKSGRKLYVYSSGSVEAQKLLFKYSQEGDLSELFSGHFDTTVGPKVEADSYKAIVKSLDCNPDNIIFLTDVPKEANAARQAGLAVVLVTREDSKELSADEKGDFSSVSTLEDVVFAASATKKQKVDETEKEATKKEVEKMEVEEDKETPKTEATEKEEPKTEDVAEKMEEEKGDEKVEDVKESCEVVAEGKGTETKKEIVKESEQKESDKMEDDAETKDKVSEEKPSEADVEKDEKNNTVPKSVEDTAKSSDKLPETNEVGNTEVEKAKDSPVKKVEKSVSVSTEKKAETEKVDTEVTSTEKKEETKTAEEKIEGDKTEKDAEVKQAEEVVEKPVEDKVEDEIKSEGKSEEKSVEKPEEKSDRSEEKSVEKCEEKSTEESEKKSAKSEEKLEEKSEKIEEKTVEKAEDKGVENEVEKGVEAKEDTVVAEESKKEETEESKKEETEESKKEETEDTKVPKQNGVENGQALNGVSNGVSGEHTEEVVVKKSAVAAPAEAEVAAEA